MPPLRRPTPGHPRVERTRGHILAVARELLPDVGPVGSYVQSVTPTGATLLGGVYPNGDNAKQFHYMVMYGMTPAQAIQAATINAADLLGWPGKVGSLEPGAWADIIAVEGDPLKDVTTLERVKFVMKGGEVVRNEYEK